MFEAGGAAEEVGGFEARHGGRLGDGDRLGEVAVRSVDRRPARGYEECVEAARVQLGAGLGEVRHGCEVVQPEQGAGEGAPAVAGEGTAADG